MGIILFLERRNSVFRQACIKCTLCQDSGTLHDKVSGEFKRKPAEPAAYHCIAIRHHGERHDIAQHDQGGENHEAQILSARGTQGLVINHHVNFIGILVELCNVGWKAFLYNLENKHKTGGLGTGAFISSSETLQDQTHFHICNRSPAEYQNACFRTNKEPDNDNIMKTSLLRDGKQWMASFHESTSLNAPKRRSGANWVLSSAFN